MLKTLFKILAIFILGVAGGIFGQIYVLPYLAGNPHFQKFGFIEKFKQGEVVISPKEEIIIQENTALKKTVEKVKEAVVGIRSKTEAGKIIEGSGLIVASDGLVVTLADIAPKAAEITLFRDGKEFSPKVLQRKQPFALLKIEDNNLATVNFGEAGKIKLGERVFLIGMIFYPVLAGVEESAAHLIVNEGVVKYFTPDLIQTNIFEKYYLLGSCLFDLGGNLVGMNTIDQEGKVGAIPAAKIKEFLGY